MKKVLVIAGPTASGKTGFSLEIARETGWSVISGDSIQVYRDMDIGSGKVTAEEMGDVTHYLLDICDPSERYTAADFQRMAREKIEEAEEGIIIAGGTGLYLKSCLYDYSFEEEEETDENRFDGISDEDLYKILLEKDPEQAEKIHPHNRRRVVRSLTILETTGRKQSEIIAAQEHKMLYDTFIAGCTMPREVLYERINRRVREMEAAGLEQEVRSLLEKGITFENTSMKGIGYKEWKGYFEGTMTAEEVIQEIQKHSRQFAKRQYTWLNHQMPVHWFNILDETEKEEMKEKIRKWIRESR